ncbi:acylphosphatase [Streptococcus pacificus]|uniref:acylphosphatase n=1 Tax=Streptococcus pacificus TaxID=2740577 RepID=A0ABS0ZJC4_9STRE|nr:acylphosphatase [Streptococcus pacificus]MBJ8326094.1 acylphosphatase [Streptococcus pacificus]
MKKVRIIVSGKVQGVGFRYFIDRLASQIGDITGRVWNNKDGTVEILAQSSNHRKLDDFILAIRRGPSRFSKVSYVDVTLDNSEEFKDFQIIRL